MSEPALPRSVLIVGSGGREHALARALAASPARPRILCAPGNAGIADLAPCFPVALDDVPGLVELARAQRAEFVVVGPEAPLALGLADALRREGFAVFGPGADGARLEASKIFTKELLLKHGIPTAKAAFCADPAEAAARIDAGPVPIVVKADGLAAGKGVVVAATRDEAKAAAAALLAGSGKRILLEECLSGVEASILVIVSGRDYVILPPAQDHKRAGDGDTGPNTGGMGTFCPAPLGDAALAEIERSIVRPSVEAIAAEGIDFRGVLFIGLMLTAAGPSVLEYNARFGDPETQSVLPLLPYDLLALLWAAAHRRLSEVKADRTPAAGAVVCVVLAAQGYPGGYAKGEPIGLPEALPPHTYILHAGTARNGRGGLVSQGGRVLNVVALGRDLAEARARAYQACEDVSWTGKYYRHDIGASLLANPTVTRHG
ncbi:MAG TPA: phosphoribosylamine--glycine ligase [Opitutaceae bacterium]|nr:phosphoribosylamine--glycine ligase [Opitutaceae bacterium]